MIKCCDCGKFISYSDIESGDALADSLWDNLNMSYDIFHVCKKCNFKGEE